MQRRQGPYTLFPAMTGTAIAHHAHAGCRIGTEPAVPLSVVFPKATRGDDRMRAPVDAWRQNTFVP